MANSILTLQTCLNVSLIGEKVLVNSRWWIALYGVLCNICRKPRQFIGDFKTFGTQECVSFHIITHYLVYIFCYIYTCTVKFTYSYNVFNIIMFQLLILNNHFTGIGLICHHTKSFFNFEICSSACLITAQIIAILHKMMICTS